MSNDNHRFVDNPRSRQQQAISENDSSFKEKDEEKHCNAEKDCGVDEYRGEIEKIKSDLLTLPAEGQEELLDSLAINLSREEVWSGLLPDPDSFGRYPEDVQKHIVAWNDAQILDESKRNDKLVEAFIKDKRRGVVVSFLINFLFLAAAFVSFIFTHDPASFGFLAVPGVTIAINVIKENRDEDK